MSRLYLILLSVVLAFLLGLVTYSVFDKSEPSIKEDSTVMIDRVRKVLKLVTIEGDIHQLYRSTQSRNITMYLPLPTRFSFDKKASVSVSGKILVGYDLNQMQLVTDVENKKVYLKGLPEPEVLAIDHQLKYLDLEESWFNSFTAEDYSRLNQRAKETLREKAVNSGVLEQAREEGREVIETVKFMVESAGYELIVEAGLLINFPSRE